MAVASPLFGSIAEKKIVFCSNTCVCEICVVPMQRIESSSASGAPTSEPYFLRAIIDAQHNQWTSKEILSKYQLGTKSNIIIYDIF